MKPLLLFVMLILSFPLFAVELYGVDLSSTNRDQLRIAVKNAGLKLIKQAGKGEFYDQYRSSSAISISSHLYLGFVKETKAFAFAEYELEGLQQPAMKLLLEQKYGKANKVKSQFLSDNSYQWESNGISIFLYQDWPNYRTRLMYTSLSGLRQLKQEMRTQSIVKRLQLAKIADKAY